MNRSVAVNALLKALFTAKVSKNLEMGAEIIKLGIESHKPLDIVINFKTPYLEDSLRVFFKDNYLTTTLNGKQLLHLYVVRYINMEEETVTLKQLLSDMDQDGFFKRYPANKRALLQLLKAENIDIDDSGNIYLATFDASQGVFVDSDVSLLWEHIFKISFIVAQLFGMIYFETLYNQVEEDRLLEKEPFEHLEVVSQYIGGSEDSLAAEFEGETEQLDIALKGLEAMPIEKQIHLALMSLSKGQLDEIVNCLGITYETYNRQELIGEMLAKMDSLIYYLELLGYFDEYFGETLCPFNSLESYLKTHGTLRQLIDDVVLQEALAEQECVYAEPSTEIPKEFEDQLSKLVEASTIDDITSIVTADIVPSLVDADKEFDTFEETPAVSDDECLSYLNKLLNNESSDDLTQALKQEILGTIRSRLETRNTK
ncbi:MAG: hypothetical protein AB9856_01710 [Cellulosilyticaceae bacterium]